MATTYLQLVNDVLARLRENQVVLVSQGTYSQLIGKLVNDAKREVEDAWNWEALRNTVTVTTAQSTYNYSLTGARDKFRILSAYDQTNGTFLEQRSKQYFNENLFFPGGAQEGLPAYYQVNGIDGSGDGKIDVYPVPASIYTLKFDLFVPEEELTDDTDTTVLPKNAIVSLAWAKAIEERGEDGGIGVSSQYAVAKQALADAISIEAGRRPDEVTWYWS
jgi:hypothetical protein